MAEKSLLTILDYKVGDEVWWFKSASLPHGIYSTSFSPGEIELVHDTIKEIRDGCLICWHCTKTPDSVWGKTRNEAWARLKADLERWGELGNPS